MKLSFVILAVCISLCVAQEVEVEEVDADLELCKRFCRSRGSCPSTSGIIFTVQRFPEDCQSCITAECGNPGPENRTMVAECMFDARLQCNECDTSDFVRQIHMSCMNCISRCTEESTDTNVPGIPTRRPTRPSPRESGRFGRFGSQTFGVRSFFGSRFLRPRVTRRRNVTICGCQVQMPCPTTNETMQSMQRQSPECRACVKEQCGQRGRSERGGLVRCVFEARLVCEQCPNTTNTEEQMMTRCGVCERRCRIFQVPVITFGRPPSGELCSNDCVEPLYCPSTDVIIATIGRSSDECQACINETCDMPTNETRDMVAQCMFQTRPDCDNCGFTSSAQRQRDRCSMCKMECENEDSDEDTADGEDGGNEEDVEDEDDDIEGS